MTRTKTRKPKLNCCTFDDYNDHNDFLYSTFTDPEDPPTMNETHTEMDEEDTTTAFSSKSNHVSINSGEFSADENEQVIQIIEQAASIDKTDDNVDVDDAFEMNTKLTAVPMAHINVMPKPRHANHEEASDDADSLYYTTDIDNITLNDAVTPDDLELDFSDVLIIKDSCQIHSDSSAILVNEEETKTDMSANDNDSTSSIVDDWDVLSAMQHLKDQDSSYDWDAISSAPSVMSMGTFYTQGTTKTLTYKDILSKRATSRDEKSKNLRNNTHDIDTNKKAPSMTRDVIKLLSSSSDGGQENDSSSLMLPIIENDECSFSPFDAYHELEGYKYSRGGKRSLQFRRKKNQKEKKKMTLSFSFA